MKDINEKLKEQNKMINIRKYYRYMKNRRIL